MDDEYQIVYVEKPEESAWGIIGGGVYQYNTWASTLLSEKTTLGNVCFYE
jgi:hypothetical protein